MSLTFFRKLAAEQPIKVVDPNPGVAGRADKAHQVAYAKNQAHQAIHNGPNRDLSFRLSNAIERANRTNSPADLRTAAALGSQYPIKGPDTYSADRKATLTSAANKANYWQQLAQLAPGMPGAAAGTLAVLTRTVPERYRDAFQGETLRNLQGAAEGVADVAGTATSAAGKTLRRMGAGNVGKYLNRVGDSMSNRWPLGNN